MIRDRFVNKVLARSEASFNETRVASVKRLTCHCAPVKHACVGRAAYGIQSVKFKFDKFKLLN